LDGELNYLQATNFSFLTSCHVDVSGTDFITLGHIRSEFLTPKRGHVGSERHANVTNTFIVCFHTGSKPKITSM